MYGFNYSCLIGITYAQWTLTKCIEKNQELHKNSTSNLEDILKPAFHKERCRTTYFPSQKPFKSDEQDMRDTAEDARTKS